MAFSSALQAEMVKRVGERLMPRLTILLPDDSELVLTSTEHCLDLSEIERRREREFGIVQAQSWQAGFTNGGQVHAGQQLAGCRCALDVGFETADIWDRAATGIIRKVIATTGSRLVLEIQEPLRELVDATLQRDMFFFTVGWLSEIQVQAVSDDSQAYSGSPTTSSPAVLDDETFVVEFLGATTYQVLDGDGNTYGPFGIASDASFGNASVPGGTFITIPAAGWSTDTGAYAADDTFVFYTSAGRGTSDLTTIGMVRHLIEDVAGIVAYDFDTDSEISPLHDSSEWTRVEGLVTGDEVGGYWRKGSRVMDMIQQLLKLSHASLYPTSLGTIGIWILEASGANTATLNGDPSVGDITLLDDGTWTEDLDECYGAVEYKYLTLGGDDASVYAAADAADTDAAGVTLTVETQWRVRGVTVSAAVSKALNRFRQVRPAFVGKTTLAGAVIDLAAGVIINEPNLSMANWRSDTIAVALDVIDNSATVEAQTDPVSIGDYFIIGESLLGTGVIW